jgi:hypothetical protein
MLGTFPFSSEQIGHECTSTFERLTTSTVSPSVLLWPGIAPRIFCEPLWEGFFFPNLQNPSKTTEDGDKMIDEELESWKWMIKRIKIERKDC